VLDDGEIMRKGRCGAFQDAEDFELVGCGPTTRASAWPDGWHDVDVVVVEAYRQGDTFDRFVGVEVVEQVRALPLRRRPTIFVVGLDADNPYLTVRLAEAGADHLYRRSELDTIADLLATVRRPDTGRRPDHGDACRRIPGLSGPTRVNEVLRRLQQMGLSEAFEPGLAQCETGFSRRQHINARELVHGSARLDADARRRTGGRQQRGIVPSWREVVEFVNRARGVELRTTSAWERAS
jgi:hypothetical protein